MGYATITGGGADGRYTVELDLGTASRDVLVAELAGKIADKTTEIDAAQVRLDEADAATNAVRAQANALIDALALAMQADPGGDYKALREEVDDALKEVIRLEGEAAKIRIPLDLLKADRANLERKRTEYTGLELERTQQAWCVDLTESASGEVATIEVPGEPQSVLIAPGAPAWTQAADGLLLNRALMTPAQAFFNAAILPGWQKWRPTFRKGTVTAVDTEADTADVTLDAAASTARGLGASGLPVNQAEALVGVPVEYMSCNAAVFEVGDRCVVRFEGQDWASPKVIGFAEWPKACELPPYIRVSVVRFEEPFDPPLASAPLRLLFSELGTCPGGGYLETRQGFAPISRRKKRIYWTSTWAGSSADGWTFDGIEPEHTLFEAWDERYYNDDGFQSIVINSGDATPATVEPIDFLRISKSYFPFETASAIALGGNCSAGSVVTKVIWQGTLIDFINVPRLAQRDELLFDPATDDVLGFLGTLPETVEVTSPAGKVYTYKGTGWQLSSGGWFALYTPDGLLP